MKDRLVVNAGSKASVWYTRTVAGACALLMHNASSDDDALMLALSRAAVCGTARQ